MKNRTFTKAKKFTHGGKTMPVGGEEKPVADVNAFQIRYRLPAVEAQEEATEEAAEEAERQG